MSVPKAKTYLQCVGESQAGYPDETSEYSLFVLGLIGVCAAIVMNFQPMAELVVTRWLSILAVILIYPTKT